MRKQFEGAPKTVEAGLTRSNLQRALFAVTIFVVMCILGFIAASCGKSSKGVVSHIDGGAAVPAGNNSNMDSAVHVARGDVDRVTMSVEGPLGGEFVFEPLDGDGSPDKKGEGAYELSLADGGGDGGSGSGGDGFGEAKKIELTITAKKDMGNSWKYALGYIEYDAEKYNPVEFKPGDLFGDDEKEVLNATLFQQKGRIAFWCGLLNFGEKDAKPGGDIGTFVIELAPWEPPRGPSIAPNGFSPIEFSDKVDNLERRDYRPFPYNEPFIIWSEVNRGDGTINGWVEIPDITLVALNYMESRPPGGCEWSLEVVDYYGNDLIGLEDSQIVYINYLTSIGGYRLEAFRDENEYYELCDELVPGPSAQVREDIEELPCNKDIGLPYTDNWYHSGTGQVGYRFWDASFDSELEIFVRLTPYDQENPRNFGVSSDLIRLDVRPPQWPVADLVARPANGNAPLMVMLDAQGSYDPDGPIILYTYDWEGDGNWDGSTQGNYAMHEYEQAGEYNPRLRIMDSDGLIDETDVGDVVVTVREPLNEVAFAQQYADGRLLDVFGRYEFVIPIMFRDTEQDLLQVNSLRIRFSGDPSAIDWSYFGLFAGEKNIKVCDGVHNPIAYWPDGVPYEGLLSPIGDQWIEGDSILFLGAGRAPGLNDVAELSIGYGAGQTPFTYDVDMWSSGNVCYFKFRTLPDEMMDYIFLEFYFEDDRCKYSDIHNHISILQPYSQGEFEPTGFTTAICDRN